MAISWLKAIKAGPGIKKAIDALVAPGASASKTVWYNLIKAGITLVTAFGLYIELSDEEIETISIALALAIPALATVLDAVASIWLRKRTKSSLADKVDRSKVTIDGS